MRLLILLLATSALLYFCYVFPAKEGVNAGSKAIPFTLPSESGQMVSLESMKGQVILLNFWATWCPPCAREIPSLNQLKRKITDPKFRLLGVSLDERGLETISAFRKYVPIEFEVLLNQTGSLAYQYGTYHLPETFLIDKNGIVVKKFEGPWDWNDLTIEALIRKYL